MWLTVLVAALLLGVARDHVEGAPTTSPRRLDDDETRSFWKGWLLLDDPSLTPEEGGRKKGQITPKSVFIAPVIKDLPDCAPGYRPDALGRCHRLVKIDQSAQLSFLLQKLNAMYSSDKFIKKPSATTEGPLHIAIPFAAAPPTSSVVPSTTTEAPQTEEVEMVVVAAEVQIKDEEQHSTSIPGAIVTLWHLNSTSNLTTADTSLPTTTELIDTSTVESTTLVTMEDTTPSPSVTPEEEFSTLTTDEGAITSTNTDTTQTEENTTYTDTTKAEDETTITESEITILEELSSLPSTTIITTAIPPKRNLTITTSTEIPLLSVHKIDADVKIVESSDLSSENTAEKPTTTFKFSPDEESGDTVINQGGTFTGTWVGSDSGYTISWPLDDSEGQRTPQHTSPSGSGWSWGNWQSSTQRPVYLNFWSGDPPPTRIRTALRRPPPRYPSYRPASLFYQELSGQDVANVFRQPWLHGQHGYRG